MIPIAARRKAMRAAGEVDTSTHREAAIVGGIVRNICATGRINRDWIATYAVDAICGFKLAGGDRTLPGPTEMGMVIERFEAAYGRRLAS